MKRKKNVKNDTQEIEQIKVKPHCKMRICEDPETGDIKILYSKSCPTGHIEKIAGKIATKGVTLAKDTEEES